MNIVPRPYQNLAANRIVRAVRKNRVALMVMATGLGKTVASALAVKKLNVFPGIFLVHDNTILMNAMEDFRKVFGDTLKFGIYNGLEKDIEGADIVFASFQTMQRNLHKFGRRQFQWMVVDEGHHSWAETFRKVIDYFWCKKIAMTATPDRADMQDIREIFGNEVYELHLEEAIARGLLPPIEYHVITDRGFDDRELTRLARRIIDKGERISMKELNSRIFIKARDKKIGRIIFRHGPKAVIFCRNIYHTKHLKRLLKNARTFHSDNTYGENQTALHGFATGEVKHLLVVNSFNEGHHLPDTDLVVFNRSTESLNVFYQQLGRGLHPGQKKLTVLDLVGSAERILQVKELAERIVKLGKRFRTLEKRKRGKYRSGRFHVSGKGFNFLFTNKVVKILKVIERLNVEFYPTWQEAGKAAVKLGIVKQREYLVRYKEDPRLPVSPHTFYPDFPGYPDYFGRDTFYRTDIYPSWKEASAAVKKIGIKSRRQYLKVYRSDPKLSGVPHRAYEDFPGWGVFLGTGRTKRVGKAVYATLAQATRAARNLGFTKESEYKTGYKQDPKLPSSPERKYESFPGWPKFLGVSGAVVRKSTYERRSIQMYSSWQEASKAAIKLGIKNGKEYRRGAYKKDPKLPSSPFTRYRGFPGWPKFLGTK